LFFQEMIHSGQNPYLSLHIAQVFLRGGDESYWPIVKRVADLASDTGKWPEAIHPRTEGGCMGDGEHGWAAAEWVLMVKNLFVREEHYGDPKLIIGQGLNEDLLKPDKTASFGPVAVRGGTIQLAFERSDNSLNVNITAEWHSDRPDIVIDVPGFPSRELDAGRTSVTLREGGHS
jgi:hypothetical protein